MLANVGTNRSREGHGVTPMLQTLLLAAVAAGPLFPPPGTYRYAATLGGQRIGDWTASVKAANIGVELDENSAAIFAGMQLAATATLVLGADLAPIGYEGSYHVPNQNPTVSVKLTATSATVSGSLTSAPQQLSLSPNTRHFVVIEPGLLAGLFALPAQLAAWNDATVTWITPTSARAQPLTLNATGSAARPPSVPPQDVLLSINSPIVVTIWYDPASCVPDEMMVPAQGAELTRER
ncbi:MAG: hypothetical protein JO113_03560 [Candidatus Eremiobacteraeota bacterium]|nr:hypothetical protein [Candidatus Eremiobacteraeota bacterium]